MSSSKATDPSPALTRREFLTKTVASAGLAATMASGRVWAGSETAADAAPEIAPMVSRPNILYVILEDIGPNLACYGEPEVATPNIDRFANESLRFTNAFCSAPVCSASRGALMTGCYQTYVGAHQHRTWQWNKKPLPPPVRHLCDWFRDGGYFTCNLQPPREGRPPEKSGGNLFGARGSGKLDLNFLCGGKNPADPFDGIDWNQRADGQPFFAHITIIETHKGGGWKLARQQPKESLVDPDKLKLPPYYPDHPVARDEYANYLDAIHLVDGYFGELLQRLEREGLAQNTIVVLSSDHGPLFRGKQFVYDNGLRIPLIVRFPDGKAAGKVDDRLVSGIDLAPTLLGFAGIKPPRAAMQGWDLFRPDTPRRGCVFAARDRMDISVDRMRAVRTDRIKYIRNDLPAVPYMQHNPYKEKNYPTWNLVKQLHREKLLSPAADLFAAETKPIEELYDLRADPFEINNLASRPEFDGTLKEMRELLDGWLKETDRGNLYEDIVDIYRGFWSHLAEDSPPGVKPSPSP